MLFTKRPIELLLIGVTVSRLGLAYGLVNAVDGPFMASAPWLTAIVLADVPNGILARRLGADTPLRRIADSVVDRITVGSAFVAFLAARPEFWIMLAPIMIRGAIVGTISATCLLFKGTIVTGRNAHKLGSLSVALMGFLFLAHSPLVWAAAVIAWILSYWLLFDYARSWKTVLSEPPAQPIYRVKTAH